ncbi:hypothetical protein C2E23DRAFT_531349 [Lenzites betulinus]|nr:hypothetical protein C2E23DRAFT_531349 [Lenzites betulinus]
MNALITLLTIATALYATAKPAVPPPMITSPPALVDGARLKARDDVSTLPLASCTLNVACCQQVLTVPVIPASFTTLLPSSLTVPVAIPTLGPVVGVECTPATSSDITGSSCNAGGSPVCCQEEITNLVAEGCQPVVNIPSPTLPISLPTTLPISLPTTLPISLPGLPTISVPGLPISLPLGGAPSSSSSGLLGLPLPSLPLPSLPGLGGDPAPSSTSTGLLGLPLPSLPLPIGGSPTSSSSGLLGLPLPSLPLPTDSPSTTSSGLLGLPLPSLPLGLASEAPILST